MKTRERKVRKNSTPVVEPREPTDVELRAIAEDHDAEDHDVDEDVVDTGAVPLTALLGSTPIDLARLGLNQIAYIRRNVVDDQPVWSIHSAAGHPLGAALTFEQAWGVVVQNELQPMYVN